jgi:hypothetical protein
MREHQVRTALRAYRRSSWGQATEDADQAAGLCKRASLVLLELLHREGVDEAQLWHLGYPTEDGGFGSTDEHYVVVIDNEAIDPSARQFDQDDEPVTRRRLAEVCVPWNVARAVRPPIHEERPPVWGHFTKVFYL